MIRLFLSIVILFFMWGLFDIVVYVVNKIINYKRPHLEKEELMIKKYYRGKVSRPAEDIIGE